MEPDRVVTENGMKEWCLTVNVDSITAKNTIEAASKGIVKGLRDRNISFIDGEPINDAAEVLKDAIINYDNFENIEVFEILKDALKQVSDKEKFVLEILDKIHKDWIAKNATRPTFDKKRSNEQIHQYLDTYFIGWNEVLKDLLFVEPILNIGGMEIDKDKLEEEYYNKIENIILENNLGSEEDFIKLAISQTEDNTPLMDESVTYGWEIMNAFKNYKDIQELLKKSSIENGFGSFIEFCENRGISIAFDTGKIKSIIDAVYLKDVIKALK